MSKDTTSLTSSVSFKVAKGELGKIEKEMFNYIESERRLWVKTFLLMNKVEKEELWKNGYHSFSAWVNDFAIRAELHVSLLWQRLKAGRAYVMHLERAGINDPAEIESTISNTNASSETLVLVDKIAGKNAAVADDLIKKVESNELTKKDLSYAWYRVRDERDEKANKTKKADKDDKADKADTDKKTKSNESVNSVDTVTEIDKSDLDKNNIELFNVTANDCVEAIRISNWITQDPDSGYKLYTEFPVQLPTSRHARRIDALAVVAPKIYHGEYNIDLHGIEIKVNKHDLLRDKKMAEYIKFVDYFWIMVTPELTEDVMNYKSDEWGVIVLKDGSAKILCKPQRYGGVSMRDITLATMWRKDNDYFDI